MIRVAETKQGTVRGRTAADPRVTAFLGIPYAAPPVGDLRWCAPEEHPAWEGVRDCLEFSPISMQSAPDEEIHNVYDLEWNVDPDIPVSEDSLYLNIWTPAKKADEKLPVFFWIYGGGLQWGNSAEMEFDGERIARRGIVVVTINYRLNVFGFFAYPGVDAKGRKVPKNIGNLDQQFALKWVYENIAAFGGDPERITIGGQSAGGGSTMSQLNCAANKDMIKGAIVMSGIFKNPYVKMFDTNAAEMEAQSLEFLEFLGVKDIDEARKLPAEFIRDKNDEFQKMWINVVDGEYQTAVFDENIKKNVFLDVPIMHGWTNNEFFNHMMVDSIEEIEPKAREIFGDMADEWLALVDTSKGLESALKDGEVASVEVSNRLFVKQMEEKGYKSPHYVYEFGAFMPGGDNPGAFHSSDLWFFFETLAKCWRPFVGTDYDMARQMCNYWCNFIKTGDPNGMDSDGTTPMETWKPYTDEDPEIMNFYTKPELKKTPADPMTALVMKYHKRLIDGE